MLGTLVRTAPPAATPVCRKARQASGLTLVELLVALALGLLVVGGAATLLIDQLGQQRKRLADARLTLTLHSVADLAVRELRRAGHWGRADDGWPADEGSDPVRLDNPHASVLPDTSSTPTPAWSYGRASTDHPELRDDRNRDNDEVGALRLNASTQALDLRMAGPSLAPGSGDHWQALTDPSRLRVTRWLVTRRDMRVNLLASCARTTCEADDALCPPQRLIRLLQIDLSGHDPAEPALTRHVSRLVRVRNDELRGRCPA